MPSYEVKMSYRTYSYFMSCPNHGIIGFATGKLTLFDGHQLTPAPSATTVTASSPSVANRGAHKTVAGLAFGAQSGQDCNLILSIHLHGEFIAHVLVNTCSR